MYIYISIYEYVKGETFLCVLVHSHIYVTHTHIYIYRAPPAFAEYVDESKANEDLIKRIVAVEGIFFLVIFQFEFNSHESIVKCIIERFFLG